MIETPKKGPLNFWYPPNGISKKAPAQVLVVGAPGSVERISPLIVAFPRRFRWAPTRNPRYIYIYVCVYIYRDIYIYMCVYICISGYMYIIYICMYHHVCMYVCLYVSMDVRMYV